MKTADKPAASSTAARKLMQFSQLALRDAQALARYAERILSGNNVRRLVGDLRKYGNAQDRCAAVGVLTIMGEIESQLGDGQKRRLAKVRSARQVRESRYRLEHEQHGKEQWDEGGELWRGAIEHAETHAAALTEAVALMRDGYGTPSFAKAVYEAAPYWPFSHKVGERQKVKARRTQKHETRQDRKAAIEAAPNVVPFGNGDGRAMARAVLARRGLLQGQDDRPDAG